MKGDRMIKSLEELDCAVDPSELVIEEEETSFSNQSQLLKEMIQQFSSVHTFSKENIKTHYVLIDVFEVLMVEETE